MCFQNHIGKKCCFTVCYVSVSYTHLDVYKRQEVTESKIWQEQIEEIIEFQNRQAPEIISVEQKQQLIKIYNKYKSVFSESPGKAKNFLCELKFKENVNFNKRSSPCLLYTSRCV